MNIHLGFEVADAARGIAGGKGVSIPLKHLAVTGQTQESGKTTTLEALITRSGLRAIAFITKRGEKSFRQMTPIAPYFQEESATAPYWKFVCSVIEAQLEIRMGMDERGWIMKLCNNYEKTGTRPDAKGKRKQHKYGWKKAKSLRDLLDNIEVAMPELRGRQEMVCIQLREYLQIIVPEIEAAEFSDAIDLANGINVMDISKLSTSLQSLVIRSVIEWVYQKSKNTIVIIPEAWQFIPQGRSTPVKLAAEELIRKGAALHNYVWIDSQDLRGVDKLILRSVGVWIFGVQREKNEVNNTLDSIPDLGRKPLATDIMRLQKGQFFAAFGEVCTKTYVQPAGMGDVHAQAIARGEERADSWKKIADALDEEAEARQAQIVADRQTAAAEAQAQIPETQISEEEADMQQYKERAEKAELEVAQLRAELESLRRPTEKNTPAIPREKTAPANGACGEECSASSLDAIYPALRNRLLAEHAVLLAVAQLKPELLVKVERRTVEMNASTVAGAIAKLLSQGFFKTPRQFMEIRTELIRVGILDKKSGNAPISNAVSRLNEMGFLTSESAGYQEVAGMKSRIVEG